MQEFFIMSRPNPIRAIMEAPLPSITYQRRKLFRPGPEDVLYAYKIINRHVFDNQLDRPQLVVKQIKGAWGHCVWHNDYKDTWAHSVITLSDKWFCQQWFMNVLAHEMVHQYQWDIYRWEYQDTTGRKFPEKSAGHGPSFFMWKDQFEHYGLTLKTAFRQKRWFKYQDFSKC